MLYAVTEVNATSPEPTCFCHRAGEPILAASTPTEPQGNKMVWTEHQWGVYVNKISWNKSSLKKTTAQKQTEPSYIHIITQLRFW